MDRRDFIRHGTRAAGLLALGTTGPRFDMGQLWAMAGDPFPDRPRLYRPPVASLDGLDLVAREVEVVHDGVRSAGWSFGEGPVGPTLVARRGTRAEVVLHNRIGEPTIVHWHGFRPPESADGHPRFAIPPGGSYRYRFDVDEPAGLYWYHPHTHHRTAAQSHLGMVGLILVRDEVEDALGLPVGERELALLVGDRQLDAAGRIVYSPRGHDFMEGYLGQVPVVNGAPQPWVEVDAALYRVRLVNVANARILRVGRSDGRPLTLIGGDVGLLPEPVTVPFVDLATAERADLLLDFGGLAAGTRLWLQTLAFDSPVTGPMGGGMRGMGPGVMGPGGMGGMGRMGGGPMAGMGSGLPQGTPLQLLEFVVAGQANEPARGALALPPLPRVDRNEARREREFRFQSAMMRHSINDRSFALNRIDEHIPFGSTEIWRFINDSPFPHSVHVHGTHFQVLGRSGGRDAVQPWERGWKDTVLVLPDERVEVIARFDRHPGIFLLHCHNLEHEDMDMMLNFQIG